MNRWAIDQELAVKSILEPTDTGAIASPVISSSFDLRTLPAGRFLIILRAALSVTGAVAHGVTFSVEDTTVETDDTEEDTGWLTAKTSGSMVKLTAVGMQAVAILPQENRPFVRVKATSDDNASLFSVSALVISLTQP
jgi:hypothetical protein